MMLHGPGGEPRRIPLEGCVLHIAADSELPPILEMNSVLQIATDVRDELSAYDTSQQASLIHQAMRKFWEQTNGAGHNKDLEDLRRHLARILSLQRKCVGSIGASQLGRAFASQEMTCRVIEWTYATF